MATNVYFDPQDDVTLLVVKILFLVS